MTGAHGGPPPPVALQVDEDSHQPGFLTGVTGWNGPGAGGCADEGVLHQVAGVFGIGCETSREPIEAIGVRIEQPG